MQESTLVRVFEMLMERIGSVEDTLQNVVTRLDRLEADSRNKDEIYAARTFRPVSGTLHCGLPIKITRRYTEADTWVMDTMILIEMDLKNIHRTSMYEFILDWIFDRKDNAKYCNLSLEAAWGQEKTSEVKATLGLLEDTDYRKPYGYLDVCRIIWESLIGKDWLIHAGCISSNVIVKLDTRAKKMCDIASPVVEGLKRIGLASELLGITIRTFWGPALPLWVALTEDGDIEDVWNGLTASVRRTLKSRMLDPNNAFHQYLEVLEDMAIN